MDKYQLHSKYGLAAFYLRRALKILEQLTEEQISESPYFVKDVLPNVIADIKKNENWLGIVQDEIQKEILKPEEDFESALETTNERHGEALKKLADTPSWLTETAHITCMVCRTKHHPKLMCPKCYATDK